MIKENQTTLNRLQVLLDMAIVLIAMAASYYIRFTLLEGHASLSGAAVLRIALIAMPVYGVLYSLSGVYNPKRTKGIYGELREILKANIIGALLMVTVLFVYKIIDFSRLQLVIFFAINSTITMFSRVVLRLTLRSLRRKGYNLKHCLLIGATEIGDDFLDRVENNKHWGYNVIGVIDNWLPKGSQYGGYPVFGGTDVLAQVLTEKYIDVVMITLSSDEFDEMGFILSQCEKAGVKSNIVPYYYRYIPTQPYMDELDGLPIIDTRRVPLDNYLKSVGKRLFDIVFALTALVLVSPVMLLSVVMIKLTSPGPIIFKQQRVGLNRKNFMMYKFRSMRVQTENEEKSQWTTPNDNRKTKWGAFMRKTSIDELPQFINVLKGDMSVVGPRPERPYFVDIFKEEIPRYMIKHQVRPGVTGWAQVNGLRGDTSIQERIEHDLYYIENWTFYFDLKIIFLTIFKGIINKNAY